jgi:hypothetical protein
MPILRSLSAWLAIAACAVAAEPPAIQGLYPAGVQSGQSTRVDLVGKPGDLPLQLWSSRPELTGQMAEDGKSLTLTAAKNAPAGVYWLRLFNTAGANRLRPFVVGTLPEVTEVEPNNTAADAQVIDVSGTVINGVLDRRDKVDMFGVHLDAGQTLVASLDADGTLGSPMDGILQLVSPLGFVVQQNDDDHGIDPQLVYTASEGGDYAVRLFSFPKDPGSKIRYAGGDDYVYRLTVTTGPFVDRVAPTTSEAIGPFELLGWNIPAGQAGTPTRNDSGLTAALALPGTWEFERLGFVPDAVQRELDPAAAANPLLLPGATWGSIETPGDRDTYTFQGTMGAKYTFSVAARSAGSPLDAVLIIRDAPGTVLQEADDAPGDKFDPAITFTPSADGSYQVEIADRFEFGGPRFFYVLTSTPERPDFTLELEQDAFIVQVGTPLDVPVKLLRTGGMAGDVTLAVENLPTGVTATMTTPAPDASGNWIVPNGTDAATIKLEAAEGTTYSGPLSIVATSGPEPQRRLATAPLVQLPFRSPHLWLTVTPKP